MSKKHSQSFGKTIMSTMSSLWPKVSGSYLPPSSQNSIIHNLPTQPHTNQHTESEHPRQKPEFSVADDVKEAVAKANNDFNKSLQAHPPAMKVGQNDKDILVPPAVMGEEQTETKVVGAEDAIVVPRGKKLTVESGPLTQCTFVVLQYYDPTSGEEGHVFIHHQPKGDPENVKGKIAASGLSQKTKYKFVCARTADNTTLSRLNGSSSGEDPDSEKVANKTCKELKVKIPADPIPTYKANHKMNVYNISSRNAEFTIDENGNLQESLGDEGLGAQFLPKFVKDAVNKAFPKQEEHVAFSSMKPPIGAINSAESKVEKSGESVCDEGYNKCSLLSEAKSIRKKLESHQFRSNPNYNAPMRQKKGKSGYER